ncbi:MAG TPA: hypothetical protein VFP84_12480 [Kofleriaceae bacterium]|nr:hypothetical protein [Kofleriaceae bacterium]
MRCPSALRPKLRSTQEWLTTVAALTAGDGDALATLRREVGAHVEQVAVLPVAWLDACEAARRMIARGVLGCLEANDFSVLQEWRGRVLRGREHASFARMLKTVILFVSLQYAGRAGR